MKFILLGSLAALEVASSLVGITKHTDKPKKTSTKNHRESSSVCWTKKPVKGLKKSSLKSLLQTSNPGAGFGDLEPGVNVFKDGYFKAACINDAMLEIGDKHGINHEKYDMHSEHVSIVRYNDLIDAGTRDPMTPSVCYDFCRTIPQMNFFGLFNGRECYCTPFFKSKAGNAGQCDAPCDGDPSQFCGGQNKSQMFSMHQCANHLRDMLVAEGDADRLMGVCYHYESVMSEASGDLETAADEFKARASDADDSYSANYAQAAKEIAGVMHHYANELDLLAVDIQHVVDHAEDVDHDDALGLEDVTEHLQHLSAAANDVCVPAGDKYEDMMSSVNRMNDMEHDVYTDVIDGLVKSYYNVNYYKDDKIGGPAARNIKYAKPSTCNGTMVTDPLPVSNMEECLYSCDNHSEKDGTSTCSGVQFFGRDSGSGVCVLLDAISAMRVYASECVSLVQKDSVVGDASKVMNNVQTAGSALRKLNKQAQIIDVNSETGAKCAVRFSATKGFEARMAKDYMEADRIEFEFLDRCF